MRFPVCDCRTDCQHVIPAGEEIRIKASFYNISGLGGGIQRDAVQSVYHCVHLLCIDGVMKGLYAGRIVARPVCQYRFGIKTLQILGGLVIELPDKLVGILAADSLHALHGFQFLHQTVSQCGSPGIIPPI